MILSEWESMRRHDEVEFPSGSSSNSTSTSDVSVVYDDSSGLVLFAESLSEEISAGLTARLSVWRIVGLKLSLVFVGSLGDFTGSLPSGAVLSVGAFSTPTRFEHGGSSRIIVSMGK